MTNLLKLEWLKIRRYRAFMWLLGFFVVSMFGICYIVWVARGGMSAAAGPAADMLIGNVFDFPSVWQTVSYLTSYLLFIPGLIIILLTANEYSFRTHRQSVINGLSRGQFMLGKIWLIVVGSLLVTVLVFIVGCIFGFRGRHAFSMEELENLGYFFIQSLTYMSAGLVLVMIFRRSGVSIGIYFLYCFILKNMLAALMNFRLHGGSGNYLPVKSADKLIQAPSAVGRAMDIHLSDTGIMLAVSLVWIVVFLWFSMRRFKTSDL
ncbi:MAG: ABC transporter permease [Alistipes sp.]|nr:ABC transporter permease [Alistipes sp.]